MTDDAELLRRYAVEKSQEAFAELVRRHIDFVYAAALRQARGNGPLAQDVVQAVFTDLARKAAGLARHEVLVGWLHTATRFATAKAIRSEQRWQAREREAQAMRAADDDEAPAVDWERLQPVLDDVLGQLKERERAAILLRFFEQRPLAEVGERLALSETAARSCVDRALEKLRDRLARRGITSTAAVLGVVLASQTGVAAPAGLAAAATSVALAAGAGGGGAVAAAGFMGMTKLQVVLGGALLVAGVGGLTWQHQANARLATELKTLRLERAVNVAGPNERRAPADAGASEVPAQSGQADAELARLGEEAAVLKQRVAAERTGRGGESQAEFSGSIFDLRQVDQKPSAKFRTPPEYPPTERQAGKEGEALVEFVVDPAGEVQEVRAIKSTGAGFAAAAVEALKRWKFQPGQKAGVPVGVRMQQRISFTLSKETQPAADWF